MLAAAACAGCGTAPLPDDDLVTGSIKPKPIALKLPLGDTPKGIAASDWLAAKLALDQALVSADADISVPWENADTGARGTATPIGAQRIGGCRDFMIAVVDGKVADRWIHGEACRSREGTVLSQVRVLGRA
ncbi:RT0821/Lpp0805 family surface protein [Xanthobacter agilis]|uniref:Surface antigen n=2 Tax=Xanthobacter agilis TaxID=47492 RepID=A0ABU0L9X5_XANAG|nr:RT0821/Lpp0805 family surface protein [Xanthobacter agilis]MDQ0503926.1 surface antigen [Xanthobacter agilis]